MYVRTCVAGCPEGFALVGSAVLCGIGCAIMSVTGSGSPLLDKAQSSICLYRGILYIGLYIKTG